MSLSLAQRNYFPDKQRFASSVLLELWFCSCLGCSVFILDVMLFCSCLFLEVNTILTKPNQFASQVFFLLICQLSFDSPTHPFQVHLQIVNQTQRFKDVNRCQLFIRGSCIWVYERKEARAHLEQEMNLLHDENLDSKLQLKHWITVVSLLVT